MAVGLVCFGVWLLLDARQLYNAALSSPIGVRRTVSISILRPIARVSEAFSLDRPVNAANRTMGRCTGAAGAGPVGATGVAVACGPNGASGAGAGNPGATATGGDHGGLPPGPTPTTCPARGSRGGNRNGRRGGHTQGGTTTTTLAGGGIARPTLPATTTAPPTTTLPPALAQLPQPSAKRPITILQIGDSLGEDLGMGLQDVLGAKPDVVLKTKGVGDTGLANIAYYNWPVALARYLAEWHPSVVLVLLGGNDCQPFFFGKVGEEPGTASFDAAYASRVGGLMSEATRAGAHVLWVGLPIMQDPRFERCMAELNRQYAAEAATHPGVTYFSTMKLFEGPHGGYSEYLTINGSLVQVRVSDGVHVEGPAGTDLLGGAVVQAMEADYHITF